MGELQEAISKKDPRDHFVAVDGDDDDLGALPDQFGLGFSQMPQCDSGSVGLMPRPDETDSHQRQATTPDKESSAETLNGNDRD